MLTVELAARCGRTVDVVVVLDACGDASAQVAACYPHVRRLAVDAVDVRTSGRPVGRTPGGYAGHLRATLLA